MQVLRSTRELISWRESLSPSMSIGFVPTMGALHAGHASLLTRARKENDLVLLSIFVNPTQFNQAADFDKYPKTLEEDLLTATKNGVDVVFAPSDPNELYQSGYRFEVREKEFSKDLCGAFRPGHFEGVLTVVMKLLNLVVANRAYFGEKDYQQFSLIRDMALDFFLKTEIVPCETIREISGLAMSSRNQLLSKSAREKAAALFQVLTSTSTPEEGTLELQAMGFRVEYLREKMGRRFIAAWLDGVRLIDNVKMPVTLERSRDPRSELGL